MSQIEQYQQTDLIQHCTTCLMIDIATPDDSNVNTKETEKLATYKHLEDRGQQNVESGDKNGASYNWSIRNN